MSMIFSIFADKLFMSKSFLKKTVLTIMCSLTITAFSFADSIYVVQKGDTLYSISKKYQITLAELRAANNLSEKDVLKAGQKLTIPDADIGTATALTATNNKPSPSPTKKTTTYTVKKGDTLYRIAKNNNMTVPDLLSLNNLDSSAVIKVGQKLKIVEIDSEVIKTTANGKPTAPATSTIIDLNSKTPDTRNYGTTINADSNTKWPVKNPKITSIRGKVSGVQLSAQNNEPVMCIHEGTVMFVGVYRGFGQVVFVQTKTGLIYAYTGMGSVKVKKGDYVVGNSELGTVGVDSISGKPQLTFMVFQNGKPMDPAKAPRS